jgi:hypothetical protein
MFCDGCGASVQPGQRFCNNCGKQIVGPVSLAQPRSGRVVLGFISLFTDIPFGTALGIYTMWVLLSSDSEREYEALAAARAA